MNRSVAVGICVLAVIGVLRSGVHAGTIVKLGLGSDSLPDIQSVGGVISTVADSTAATLGDQNTEVSFLGPLAGQTPVTGSAASFTLSDVQLMGDPHVVASVIVHQTMGGTFQLYDPSDQLLLAGTLGNGVLSGPLGVVATGGFLSIEFGQFTAGSLLPILEQEQLLSSSLSIGMTSVNNGMGFELDSQNRLRDFRADASANIGAQLPEPASGVLAVLAGGFMLALCQHRRSVSPRRTPI